MGLKKLAAKVAAYNERLEAGKASKIKRDHVERVLEKLLAKRAELESEIAEASDKERKTRLERKLHVAREQISRAEWLLEELG